MAASDPSQRWGTCTYCGDAFPPNALKCPTCGNTRAVQPGSASALPRKERYHLRFVQSLRLSIVVGVIAFLAYLMVSAVYVPPPTVSDPLTTRGSWVIGAGNYTGISGEVTGADYIVGNYSVSDPPGAVVTFLVFNDTEYHVFSGHGNATPVDRVANATHAQIVFSAPYTDTFHFVWVNGYTPASEIALTVYVVTSYESNALVQ